MSKTIVILILLALPGCSSFNLARTVAGGADGQVDYDACVSFMGNELICVNLKASRADGQDTETTGTP